MTEPIYLRPIVLEDAQTSYAWRNDPEVWRYTKFAPTRYITPEIEALYLAAHLKQPDQRRFAICVSGSNEYIGNVQLVRINNNNAELHIFIGNKQYWGKGVGYKATVLMMDHGFNVLGLEHIYLGVHPDNMAAISIYRKAGFEVDGLSDNFIKMVACKHKSVALSNTSL